MAMPPEIHEYYRYLLGEVNFEPGPIPLPVGLTAADLAKVIYYTIVKKASLIDDVRHVQILYSAWAILNDVYTPVDADIKSTQTDEWVEEKPQKYPIPSPCPAKTLDVAAQTARVAVGHNAAQTSAPAPTPVAHTASQTERVRGVKAASQTVPAPCAQTACQTEQAPVTRTACQTEPTVGVQAACQTKPAPGVQTGCQTAPAPGVHAGSQTEANHVVHAASQTKGGHVAHASSQTKGGHVAHAAAQTEPAAAAHVAIQAEPVSRRTKWTQMRRRPIRAAGTQTHAPPRRRAAHTQTEPGERPAAPDRGAAPGQTAQEAGRAERRSADAQTEPPPARRAAEAQTDPPPGALASSPAAGTRTDPSPARPTSSVGTQVKLGSDGSQRRRGRAAGTQTPRVRPPWIVRVVRGARRPPHVKVTPRRFHGRRLIRREDVSAPPEIPLEVTGSPTEAPVDPRRAASERLVSDSPCIASPAPAGDPGSPEVTDSEGAARETGAGGDDGGRQTDADPADEINVGMLGQLNTRRSYLHEAQSIVDCGATSRTDGGAASGSDMDIDAD